MGEIDGKRIEDSSQQQYKLSVGIVAYHDYDDIRDALETMNQFTDEKLNKRVYVIDNSNENSKERSAFEDTISSFPDVVYLDTKDNLGFGKGHNYVLSNINSEYHCIMNPDIVFCEDAFSPIIQYLDEHLDVGMVIPNITDENGNRLCVYRKEPTVTDMFIRMFCKNLFPKRVSDHTLQNMDYSEPFQVPFGQGSFLVIRTDLFKRIGGFDDGFFMYLEDADLCKRVNQMSKLMYIPNSTVIHKWKKGSHKNLNLFKIHVSSMVYYFNKWGWKWK